MCINLYFFHINGIDFINLANYLKYEFWRFKLPVKSKPWKKLKFEMIYVRYGLWGALFKINKFLDLHLL